MLKNRFWPLAGGTVFCAIAIGFVMQNVLVQHVDARLMQDPDVLVEEPAVVTRTVSVFPDIIEAAAPVGPVKMTAPLPDDLPRHLPIQVAAPELTAVVVPDPCKIDVQARPISKARVQIDVHAPCSPNTIVTVHHTGFSFSDMSDADGFLQVTLPALTQNAISIVTVDGRSVVATAQVPDLDAWHRVAVQWSDDGDFQIHAREFGAAYHGPGHVWHGRPENPLSGSFITRLGSAELTTRRQMEVYSIPADQVDHHGGVALSVETEVTDDSCGTRVSAQVLERHSGTALQSRDVLLDMPACSAIGDFLVLNNLLDDLKIAAK